jgi:hypothetical protein
MDDQVRVQAKKIDDLQAVISLCRTEDLASLCSTLICATNRRNYRFNVRVIQFKMWITWITLKRRPLFMSGLLLLRAMSLINYNAVQCFLHGVVFYSRYF